MQNSVRPELSRRENGIVNRTQWVNVIKPLMPRLDQEIESREDQGGDRVVASAKHRIRQPEGYPAPRCARRQAAGGCPVKRLKAREKAASES